MRGVEWNGKGYSDPLDRNNIDGENVRACIKRMEMSHLTAAREVNGSVGNLCYGARACVYIRQKDQNTQRATEMDKTDAFLDTRKPTKRRKI